MFISRLLRSSPYLNTIASQNYASCAQQISGLVIGVYDSVSPDGCQEFTEAGERLNGNTNGYLREIIKNHHIPLGKTEIFSGLGINGYNHLAVTGLGPKEPNKLNLVEDLNEEKENIRVAMAVGARGVQDRGANQIFVDGATVPEAAAEGSILGTYMYKANSTGDKSSPSVALYDHPDANSWASGEINAECQNYARFLSHAPPNFKKAESYASEIMSKLCKFDIRVDIRNREWMTIRKMHATLSLVKGNCDPPLLVEISYCGDHPQVKPILLVGKGSIFDSGGLFLKPYKGIHEYRADMAGSAAIVGTIMAVARKRLPINVRSAILLYENMPTPMGLKPGDIVKDKAGRHIQISDPDNDCRVVLADIVNFVTYYNPQMIINIGSFTMSAMHALGTAASAAFCAPEGIWSELHRAGLESGDRLWRMPFWNFFRKLNKRFPHVDMDNGSAETGGDCCQAATFLEEFIPVDVEDCCCPTRLPYIHVDCFGTGLMCQTEEEVEPYYRKEIKMGRPTRALVQFLYQRACLLPRKPRDVKHR